MQPSGSTSAVAPTAMAVLTKRKWEAGRADADAGEAPAAAANVLQYCAMQIPLAPAAG